MARQKANKAPLRTEVVGVRLDPKLKYLCELAARHQRRSLASYIEWTLQDALKRIVFDRVIAGGPEGKEREIEMTLALEGAALWHVEPADRLARLALLRPGLMNFDEQTIWQAVKETSALWDGEGREAEQLITERFRRFYKIAVEEGIEAAVAQAKETEK